MNQRVGILITILAAFGFLSMGDGCKTPTEDSADVTVDTENLNPNSPNANHLITQQRLIGDSDKGTSIWAIIDSGDGGFFFRGYYNNKYAVGKLDASGQEIWVARSKYRPSDIAPLPDLSGELNNSLLSTGSFDSDLDERDDIGYVSLFTSGGELIDELVFEKDSAEVRLRAIEISSATDTLVELVGVGGALVSGVYYPYLAVFTVANDGTMSKMEDKLFMDHPDMYFNELAIDGEGLSATCYVRGGEYFEGAGYGNQFVFRMTEEMGMAWDQDIVSQEGMQAWSFSGEGLVCSSNFLYTALNTDFDKDVDPVSGGFWDAGVVARLSTAGSVNWVRTIVLSQYSEQLFDCCLSEGTLYVAGSCSNFMKSNSKEEFGNALLLRIDPNTGNTEATLSFGDVHYHSEFNDVIVRGTQAFAVGYSKYDVQNGPYQGWFTVIDAKGSPTSTAMATESMDSAATFDLSRCDDAEAIHLHGKESRR